VIPSFHCVWCACPSSGSALFAPVFLFALAGCGGSAPTPPEPLPAERIVEGFELGSGWKALPGARRGRIRIQAGEDPSGERLGRSLQLRFDFAAAEDGVAVVQVPLQDVDASGFDHLAFWIRGDPQAGFGPSVKIRLRRPGPKGGGRWQTGSFVVDGIGERWERVMIPLNRMPGIREWTHLSDFLLVIQARRLGVESGGYHLDEIALVRTGHPGPSATDPVAKPAKRAWRRNAGGPEQARRLLRQRLAGYPARVRVDPGELPEGGREFLSRVASDTWRGLDALTDRASGLPIDNLRFTGDSTALAEVRIGDFTNVTNVGLHLIAIVAAHDLGLLERGEALARLERLLDTLERLETHRGFFFNYYDTTSLERSSNFVSFLDSAWLTAGLLVARSAFPEIGPRCTRLVERGDYAFFYDPVERLMSHGYWTQLAVPSEYHYGVFYTEARLGSLIAIGKGDVPLEHWTELWRGFTRRRSERRWRGIGFVPSWGGSMFEALMPILVLDELRLAPQTLGRNDEVHAVIQRRYALEELGYPVWGLSPSATPGTGAYAEYGARPLGLRGYPSGVVAPYASALALAVTPQEAEANLRQLADSLHAYGEYGFYDAVDPRTGRVAYAYLALDQSMLFLALANHLGDGCVRKRFAQDPVVQRALPLLGDAGGSME
jgi:hypothetical protein